jgi:hypothetical protein
MTQTAFNFTAPRSRRSDPASSKRAEDQLRQSGALNGQLLTAYEAMKRHPGKSSRETAEITGLDRYMLARRYADLFRTGKALKVEIGKRDVLWYAIL